MHTINKLFSQMGISLIFQILIQMEYKIALSKEISLANINFIADCNIGLN
jgi:hypothetical protein